MAVAYRGNINVVAITTDVPVTANAPAANNAAVKTFAAPTNGQSWNLQ